MDSQMLEKDKKEIIQWVSEIHDNELIDAIKSLMPDHVINENQKKAIDKALVSINKNGTLSHEQVMVSTREKYPYLSAKNK